MSDRYWVGGSGTWDSSATTHWSASSGGSSGASAPTASDDVHFDSSNPTVTLSGALCNNLICEGTFAGKFQGSGALTVSGSLTFISSMGAITASGTWTFNSTANGKTITTAGQTLNITLTFNGVGGVWTLQDALAVNNVLTLTNGSLNTNGNTLTCSSLNSNNSNTGRTLTLDNSTIILNGTNATPLQFGSTSGIITGLTWSTTNTIFQLSTTSSTTYTLNMNTLLIPTLKITGPGSGDINIQAGSGNQSINSILLLPGATRNLVFQAAKTFTITNTSIIAPWGSIVTLKSGAAGTQFTLAKSGGGTVECQGIKVKDCLASPTNTFYCRGISGANISNNTNWGFTPRLNSSIAIASTRNIASSRTAASARTALVE